MYSLAIVNVCIYQKPEASSTNITCRSVNTWPYSRQALQQNMTKKLQLDPGTISLHGLELNSQNRSYLRRTNAVA